MRVQRIFESAVPLSHVAVELSEDRSEAWLVLTRHGWSDDYVRVKLASPVETQAVLNHFRLFPDRANARYPHVR